MMSLLLGRMTFHDVQFFIKNYFNTYTGTDKRLIGKMLRISLSEDLGGQIDWEGVKRISILAKKANVPISFGVVTKEEFAVPEDVAMDILEGSAEHHWDIVSVCESSLRARVAGRAKKLSVVADEEGWFCQDR